jgi:uncharacterized protein (DUF362 family)
MTSLKRQVENTCIQNRWCGDKMVDVAIVQDPELDYCREAPFHPPLKYPEYPFQHYSRANPVYSAVRMLFLRLGLDKEHYDTDDWNPLGQLISPGDAVVIKPNLVRHYNPQGSMEAQITHGSIIRAVLDYVYLALKGAGTITIGDAPVQSCNFEETVKIAGIDKIVDYYNTNTEMRLKLVDFRKYAGYPQKSGAIERIELPGDPEGYTLVNLGEFSEFSGMNNDWKKFRVTNYDSDVMQKYHNVDSHSYLVANSILHADVIINLPKLKTHRKAGMTGALKNMVGIIGSKDCLPHHRIGSQEEGGDEYLHRDIRKRMATRLHEIQDRTKNPVVGMLGKLGHFLIYGTQRIAPSPDAYAEGSWYGNDTIPRTIVDLNKIIFFADKRGILQENPQRKALTVVDAIIAGEKEGPLEPSPKPIGTLVAGENPVGVDLTCSQIMGFDHHKIPTLKCASGLKLINSEQATDEIQILADEIVKLDDVFTRYGHHFNPTSGWKGHIERKGE